MSAITISDIPELADLEALGSWLMGSRNALAEGPSGIPNVPAPVGITAEDEAWSIAAAEKVEQAVDLVVDDFTRHPYRHRVEHSLHLQIYGALIKHHQFQDLIPVGGSPLHAGLVHKEWPETLLEADAERRGLFDLAVLAPSQLARASLEQYRQGRIHAPIVIEVGLDYGAKHLQQDINKLLNSKVPHAHVVHLSRLPTSDNVEDLLTTSYPTIKTAFAHVSKNSRPAVKHLNDGAIQLL